MVRLKECVCRHQLFAFLHHIKSNPQNIIREENNLQGKTKLLSSKQNCVLIFSRNLIF